MFRTDDPLDDLDRHEREQERLAAKLPTCDYCGKSIDDHYFNINGDIICGGCLNDNFKVAVELW